MKLDAMDIRTVCIAGAGTMGRGIAQVAAQSGFKTILFELNASVLNDARDSITKQINRMVEKGKVTEQEGREAIDRLTFTTKVEDCRADIIIEAIIEKLEAKLSLFGKLEEINTGKCIFASNTSSLSVTEISRGLRDASSFIGMHFFNPAPVMKLVEIITTESTSEEVKTTTLELTRKMGKTPVVCKDSPGFIVNRVARPFYIESLRLVEEGVTNFEQLDTILEATGFRMGPFHLMDLIGNDVNYAVTTSVYTQLNEPIRLKPSDIQKKKVEAGQLGRKTGKGYYEYPG